MDIVIHPDDLEPQEPEVALDDDRVGAWCRVRQLLRPLQARKVPGRRRGDSARRCSGGSSNEIIPLMGHSRSIFTARPCSSSAGQGSCCPKNRLRAAARSNGDLPGFLAF
ncbi:MAG: hypothetical protein KY450_12520 [Actinobacteria bacterium]|nr:hypothetical protein [Actinomycetota bacterium]